MKRAAAEQLRTRNRWMKHLRLHRIEGATSACVCELQMGRFRKGQRIGGCGKPQCWLCHSGKLGREPTTKQLRSLQTYREGLAEALLANNTLERAGTRRGRPVLAMIARSPGRNRRSCSAAELHR